MNLKNRCLLVAFAALTLFSGIHPVQADIVLSQAENELGELINQYRIDNGLAAVPVTVSLTEVAQLHVVDAYLYPHQAPCNLHSWSANGNWSPVCYLPDNSNAQGMWDKPREITGNIYTGNGYEIISAGFTTSQEALLAWQNSPAHNDVLLNQGIWSNFSPWSAMGVGVHEGYRSIWFGSVVDPQGLASHSVPEPSAAMLLVVGFGISVIRHSRTV